MSNGIGKNPLNDISKVYLEQVGKKKKKDDSYLETDMKKRQENNEKARKDMEKMGTSMKNPHFEQKQFGWDSVNSMTKAYRAMQEGIRDEDPEKGTEERKKRLEKKRGMKMDDHPQYKKEEVELDENRRAARAAGGFKDDSKKQPDPSKDGFTGIGNMSIDAIRKMSARIEKEESEKKKTKKEETELLQYPSEKKITVEQIIALNKKYGKVQEGMGLVTGTAKAVNKVLKPVGQTPEEGKKAVGNLTKAMDTVAKPVKSAAKAVLGVSPEKNAAMMQKRRP